MVMELGLFTTNNFITKFLIINIINTDEPNNILLMRCTYHCSSEYILNLSRGFTKIGLREIGHSWSHQAYLAKRLD